MTEFDFKPGVTYIVKKAFADFDGSKFRKGEKLTYRGRDYHVYDGGLTLYFEGRGMRFRDVEQPEIVNHFENYFEAVPHDTWSNDAR